MNKKKNILLTIISFSSILVISSCTDEKSQVMNVPEDEQPVAVTELEEIEKRLENFSKVLPEAFKDSELAKIVYEEAKSNEEYEAYALWSKVADKPTQKGTTLRKNVQNALVKRSLCKLADAERLTSALDEIDYLQIYICDFEEWKGESPLPSTFTPLTINDIDVTELTVYDTLGSAYTLEVDTIPPDYPIAVVGINEMLALNDEFSKLGKNSIISNSNSSGYYLKIYKLKMETSASNYEPWTNGTHAEFYWIIRDNGLNIYQGLDYGDDGIDHRVWTWSLWKGFRTDYSWQTHNHLTKFNASDYYNWHGSNFRFDMWEYDVSSSDDPMGSVYMNFPYANIQRSTHYSIDYSFEWKSD